MTGPMIVEFAETQQAKLIEIVRNYAIIRLLSWW